MAMPGHHPARREARLVAGAVDAVVLALSVLPCLAVAALVMLLQTDWGGVDAAGREWTWGAIPAAIWLLVPPLYFTWGARRPGTLGARLLGLRVVDERGGRPSRRRAAGRALLLCAGLIGWPVLGVVMAVHRAGHGPQDALSGTVMVEAVRR